MDVKSLSELLKGTIDPTVRIELKKNLMKPKMFLRWETRQRRSWLRCTRLLVLDQFCCRCPFSHFPVYENNEYRSVIPTEKCWSRWWCPTRWSCPSDKQLSSISRTWFVDVSHFIDWKPHIFTICQPPSPWWCWELSAFGGFPVHKGFGTACKLTRPWSVCLNLGNKNFWAMHLLYACVPRCALGPVRTQRMRWFSANLDVLLVSKASPPT